MWLHFLTAAFIIFCQLLWFWARAWWGVLLSKGITCLAGVATGYTGAVGAEALYPLLLLYSSLPLNHHDFYWEIASKCLSLELHTVKDLPLLLIQSAVSLWMWGCTGSPLSPEAEWIWEAVFPLKYSLSTSEAARSPFARDSGKCISQFRFVTWVEFGDDGFCCCVTLKQSHMWISLLQVILSETNIRFDGCHWTHCRPQPKSLSNVSSAWLGP